MKDWLDVTPKLQDIVVLLHGERVRQETETAAQIHREAKELEIKVPQFDLPTVGSEVLT